MGFAAVPAGPAVVLAAGLVAGLEGCLFLAFWVRPAVWLTGLVLVAVGLPWHVLRRRGR